MKTIKQVNIIQLYSNTFRKQCIAWICRVACTVLSQSDCNVCFKGQVVGCLQLDSLCCQKKVHNLVIDENDSDDDDAEDHLTFSFMVT